MSVTGRGGWRRWQRYASGRAPASGNEITHHELERFGRHPHFGHRTARPHPLWVSDHRIDERCGCARRRPEIGTELPAFPIQLVTTKTRQSLAQQGPRLLSFKGGESARRKFLATTGARNSTRQQRDAHHHVQA